MAVANAQTHPVATSPYAELKRRVQAAGLMRANPLYYSVLIGANVTALAAVLVLLRILPAGWATVLLAVALGFVSGQLGFQLHDSGHHQMFRRRSLNLLVSFVTANLLLGMSSGWWIDKHNRHHGNPNHVDLDPDIQVGMISYSTEQALEKRGVHRFVAARQAYFFFPLLFGLALAMHASGAAWLAARRWRQTWGEIAALAVHAVVYVGLLVALVGPWWALAVIAIHKGVGGFYMAMVFAPNHKGMPQVLEGEQTEFLHSQVLTSRNVRSHPATDFLYGGLNYQIEHHLFPTMPRCNVRAAQPIVKAYCEEIGVEYYETSIIQSYREILGYLHEVGDPLRARRAVAA